MRPVVVLDSNIFVAALLKSASCREILSEWRKGSFVVAVSPALRRELTRVLKRPKFRHRISPVDREELLAFIAATALTVRPVRLRHPLCRDPSDDKVFACAFAAGASCIVSGDADVFAVAPIGGLRILSPREFLTWLARR